MKDDRIGDKVKIIRCMNSRPNSHHDNKFGVIVTLDGEFPLFVRIDKDHQCSPIEYINFSARGRRAHATFLKTHKHGKDGRFEKKMISPVKVRYVDPDDQIDWEIAEKRVANYLDAHLCVYTPNAHAKEIISLVKKELGYEL